MAPSRYDWKIVDWDVKPQHNQPTNPLKRGRFLNMERNERICQLCNKKNKEMNFTICLWIVFKTPTKIPSFFGASIRLIL